MTSALSKSVFYLLHGYVELIPMLPAGNRRAALAQARKSVTILFGMSEPNECNEISALLNIASEDLVVNIWDLMRACERSVYRLPPDKLHWAEDKAFNLFLKVFRILIRKLYDEEINIRTLEGRDYDPNEKVEVINYDDYEDGSVFIVSEMIEPIILKKGETIRFGKILISHKGASN